MAHFRAFLFKLGFFVQIGLQVDWWTKYFSSPGATGAAGRVKLGPAFGGNKVRILQRELEDETSTFDVAKKHRYVASEAIKAFEMVRGKAHDLQSAGVFKGDIAVFDAEKTAADVTKWDRLPPQGKVDCVVRNRSSNGSLAWYMLGIPHTCLVH